MSGKKLQMQKPMNLDDYIHKDELRRRLKKTAAIQQEKDRFFEQLHQDLAIYDLAKARVFAILPLATSPAFLDVLSLYRSQLNDAVNKVRDNFAILRHEAKTGLLSDISDVFVDSLDQLERHMLASASSLNDACTSATTDKGVALSTLAIEVKSPADRVLKMLRVRTEHIEHGTKTKRYRVYLGNMCNILRTKGIKNVRDQWQWIYDDLERNQARLLGDEKSAWEYLRDVIKPYELLATAAEGDYLQRGNAEDALRRFEKDLSKMIAKHADELTTN